MEPASMLAHRLKKLAAQADSSQEVSEAIRAFLQLERDSRAMDFFGDNIEQYRTRVIGRMKSL